MFSSFCFLLFILVGGGHYSPAPLAAARSVPSSCTALASLVPSSVDVSSYCSSYIQVQTTYKTVATVTTTTTTLTLANAATTTVYLPGDSPLPRRHPSVDAMIDRSTFSETTEACGCLELPDKIVVEIAADHETVTFTASTVAQTVYPCATTDGALPSPGPAYGKAQNTGSLGLSNNLYGLSTSEGSSATACCNTCFFEIQNCIQAWWYFYEGCVVSQATDLSSATGSGISSVCPAGSFSGLSYVPDYSPAFRSTGDIAGPCGSDYTNI